MSGLVLLTAPDCHLCGHGREVLGELGSEWREVSDASEEGQRLAVAAPPLRPVLYAADGSVVAYGRLSLKRLRRQLFAEGQPRRMSRATAAISSSVSSAGSPSA
jgi:hypothetical protein